MRSSVALSHAVSWIALFLLTCAAPGAVHAAALRLEHHAGSRVEWRLVMTAPASAAGVEAAGPGCPDLDNDGYTDWTCGGLDCDDSDPTVYPGATEVCDGKDNNCDGYVDEGVSTAYYLDDDGDGYGVDGSDILSCEPVSGYSALGGDCDDNDPNIHPGAAEVLDGVDNNCDGTVDEGFENPILRSIVDVPGDQGRAVRLRWRRHAWDFAGSATPVVSYSIFRQVQPGQAPAAAARAASREGALALPAGEWDLLTTLAAYGDSAYQTVVPTLCDSNATDFCRTTFVVRAQLQTPTEYSDSAPDSGWSVDNIVPGVPTGLTVNAVSGTAEIAWDPSPAPDFQYFRVYRGQSPDFTPDAGHLVQVTAATSWVDDAPGGETFYKVTAVDANGNESGPASNTGTVDVNGAAPPAVLALAGVVPNPFRGTTVVHFDLPGRAAVRLAIHDVAGRRVRTLLDQAMTPGRYQRTWNGRDDAGRAVPPGTYFVRLVAGGHSITRPVMLVR